jgi:hypothetical protein
MKKIPFLFCLSLFIQASTEELHIEVNDPIYKDGVLFTHNGGVIQSEKLRVQARNLELKEVDGAKILTATEDLFLIYGKKFFVGDLFTYNFSTQQGFIKNGICNAESVFIDGETILFNSKGGVSIEKAALTTSENKKAPILLKAKDVNMNEEYKVKAKGLTLSAYDTPLLYVPSYSRNVNKKFQSEPSVTYRATWERKQGPLFLMRYRVYDGDDLKVFWRGEFRSKITKDRYFIPRGAGTAIEIDYADPSKKLFKFASRNFYAYDTFYNDTDPNKYRSRYRIQGLFNGTTKDKKIETFGRWDALSDRNMRSDFPTQMFELQTLERTEGFIKARYDTAFTSLYVRPRINMFQGFKQELPTIKVAVKPYEIAKTGAILENYFKLAYLDYSYSDTLHNAVSDFSSARLETSQTVSRPTKIGFIHITPKLSLQNIFYSEGKKSANNLQSLFHYDLSSHTTLEKTYSDVNHEISPYLEFHGLANPTIDNNNVYIFSVQDGYHTINELKLGFKNSFFARNEFSPVPKLSFDLYAYNFFRADTFNTLIPKGYLDFALNYPSLTFQTNLGWNFEQNSFDHANFALSWTINEYFAASIELRQRSKFEWKKDHFSNYMLDVARSAEDLLNSPLSDERTSIFTRWQIQLSPLTSLQVQNHVGFRPNEPFYHESKFDFFTTITNTWKLRLSYTRTARANQYSFGINLI